MLGQRVGRSERGWVSRWVSDSERASERADKWAVSE